jgi:hypothetical protein
VEFNGALGDVELAGDFLVRKILEERIENFLFAATEVGDGIGFQAASLVREDRIHESGENRTRYPEAAIRDERQCADELLAGFFVREDSLNAQTQERKTVGVLMLIADNDEARVGEAFNKIGEKCPGGLTGGMRVVEEMNGVSISPKRLGIFRSCSYTTELVDGYRRKVVGVGIEKRFRQQVRLLFQ